MGNIGVTFKRFLGNKNTVTIIGVIVGIVVLYFGYNWRVNQAVDPIRVPFATRTIAGNTRVTAEMVGHMNVNRSVTQQAPDMVTTSAQVVGRFVRYDTTIPQGSPFFSSQLMLEETSPDFLTQDIPDVYTLFMLPVTLQTTFGNAIMPDNRIDLYFTAEEDGLIIYGRFIESIRVIAVRDSRGQNVFSSASTGDPAFLFFAVRSEGVHSDHFLLNAALLIRNPRVQITPIPRNRDFTENPGYTRVTSEEIRSFILARAVEPEQTPGTGGQDGFGPNIPNIPPAQDPNDVFGNYEDLE